MADVNRYIYERLEKEMMDRFKQHKPHNAIAYSNAIETLKHYFKNVPIATASGDRINGIKFPGIGKGIVSVIAQELKGKVIIEDVPEIIIDVEIPKKKGKPSTTVNKGPLLAQTIKSGMNPVGWWMSEKWDGYRAIWDGREFYSRNGNVFEAPSYFKNSMPKNVILDGELWIGRGEFEKAGIFRHKYPDPQRWKEYGVKYKVFDIPSSNKPFEQRMEILRDLVKKTCRNKIDCPLEFTEQIKVRSREHLSRYYQNILGHGGEGVMLRQPASKYVHSRSGTLLKVKPYVDTECTIVGYNPGTGKYKGQLGSFICKGTIKGVKQEFNVSGMTDSIRRSYKRTHPKGTVITIRYTDLTQYGKPRNPRYMHKRGHATGKRHLTMKDFPPSSSSVWSSYNLILGYMRDKFAAPLPPSDWSENNEVLCDYLKSILIDEQDQPRASIR